MKHSLLNETVPLQANTTPQSYKSPHKFSKHPLGGSWQPHCCQLSESLEGTPPKAVRGASMSPCGLNLIPPVRGWADTVLNSSGESLSLPAPHFTFSHICTWAHPRALAWMARASLGSGREGEGQVASMLFHPGPHTPGCLGKISLENE